MDKKTKRFNIILFLIMFSFFCVSFVSLKILHDQRVLVVEKFISDIQRGRNDEANKLVISPETLWGTIDSRFAAPEDWIITHQPFFLIGGGTFQGQYIDQSGEFGYWYVEVRRDWENYSSGGQIWQYGASPAGSQDKDWQTIKQDEWDGSDDRMNMIRSFILLFVLFLGFYWVLMKGIKFGQLTFYKHIKE